jgi:hypothetical protein
MLDEKIELLINGKKFANWFDLEVTLSVDSFDSIGFSAPFEPARKEFRDTFRPFSFAPIQVLLNDDPLFTGTMIDIDPQTSADAKMVSVKCYAFPGVLCDCTAPTNNGYKGRRPKGALKTEFKKGLSLKDIAQQLCDPFDLDCEFRGDVGPKFDKAFDRHRRREDPRVSRPAGEATRVRDHEHRSWQGPLLEDNRTQGVPRCGLSSEGDATAHHGAPEILAAGLSQPNHWLFAR